MSSSPWVMRILPFLDSFKLLLPDMGTYDQVATWERISADEPAVGCNSSVLF